MATPIDIADLSSKVLFNEDNEEIKKNVFTYPIGKAFLDLYPQYYDIITTYDHAIEDTRTIISSETIIDKEIRISDKLTCSIKIYFENVRIYSADSPEAYELTSGTIATSPNIALAIRANYCCVLVADMVCEYIILNNPDVIPDKTAWKRVLKSALNPKEEYINKIRIPNGYIVQIPIPVGSKYCVLKHYDEITLCRTGEEMKEFYGMFIIEGYFKYIIPIYKKPFNKPIIQKKMYEGQLSRTDVIYAKKFDYEESNYIVPAMLLPTQSHTGKRGAIEMHPDFGCSLQLNHPLMNFLRDNGKRNKKLWNFVPIKYLFYAFGCVTDEQMLEYIHPEMNNLLIMNIVKNACVFGFKHLEALEIANIPRKEENGYIRPLEPLNEDTALWVIGCIILSDKTHKDTIKRVGNNHEDYKLQIIQITRSILDDKFMPGVGDNSNIDRNEAICIELGNIIRKLYLIGYNFEESQDKTSLTNRRVRNGQQLSREFKAFHKKRLNEIYDGIDELLNSSNVQVTGQQSNLQQKLESKLLTSIKIASTDQSKSLINSFKGVSKENSKMRTDLLNPKNIGFTWNRLREIVITQDTKTQGSEVSWDHRTVHPSDLFYICPTQTPESGDQTGKYRTPTIYTYVTLTSDPEEVMKVIKRCNKVTARRPKNKDASKIYSVKLNGSCVGWIEQPVKELYESLHEARRTGEIAIDVSIILNHNQHEIIIWTDTGRLVSPFVVVKNTFNVKAVETKGNIILNSKYTIKKDFTDWLEALTEDSSLFYEGISKGYIEFICPDMAINNCVIADCPKNFYENPIKYTHIALPGHIHGVVSNIVPGVNLVTGVRASYLTNHVKQAIGPTVRYPQCKYMTLNNVLISPQVPIARGCPYDFMHVNDHAIGQNVIVAFMQYKDNQEDAIILNRASVEQGLLCIDSIQTFEHKLEHSEEEFRMPSPDVEHIGNTSGYDNLDPQTCLPKDVSLKFNQFDPLISKITINTMNLVKSNNATETFMDSSIINETLDGSYQNTFNPRCMRSVVKNSLLDQNKTYKKVSYGRYCAPIPGDKFNPEYCQKGTVGKVTNTEFMPYATNGMRPDIIFNPPAVFRRKTYGHVYYSIIAKIATLLGCQLDLTGYHSIRTQEDVDEILRKMGLDVGGYETMYDPITGEEYKAKIYFGMHYWERQAHLVEMKINVRNGGPRNAITGQPLKGRKRNGGQQIDHMTYDAEIAAGISNIMADLHLNQGSSMHTGICNRCHSLLCYYKKNMKTWVCPQCGQHCDITIKKLAPGSNLLFHIFNGLHLGIDYYQNVDMYKEDNAENNETTFNEEQYKNARIIAYQKYLDKYNFIQRTKHNVVIFGQENEKQNKEEYKPLLISEIMPDYN